MLLWQWFCVVLFCYVNILVYFYIENLCSVEKKKKDEKKYTYFDVVYGCGTNVGGTKSE